MRIRALLAPLACTLTAGCLATKGDIRLVQDDLSSMRAQSAQQAQMQEKARLRADSIERVRVDSAIAALTVLNDSLHVLSARFMAYQANANESMREVGLQLTALQNRVGVSQQQIQALVAQQESQPAVGADTTGHAAAAPQGLPGPATMYQLGLQQYENGGYDAALSAFRQLLHTYPAYSNAPHVVLAIGECYDALQQSAAADSVYQVVIAQYPKSPDAPTALFKYGASQAAQGKVDAARKAWERVLHDYPTSDEAKLVPDRLKALPGK